MVQECFFEIPEGQIHIFSRVFVCQLCEFDEALGGSWALLGGFGAVLGAPKWALGGSGGVLEERVRPPEGSREPREAEKRDFGAVVAFPETLQTLRI